MAELSWRDFKGVEQLVEAAASRVEAVIVAAVAERGRALIAVPGGKTPTAIFDHLAGTSGIDWGRVTLVPTDDRLVPETDPLSNLHLIRSRLASTGVTILSLTRDDTLDVERAAAFADRVLCTLRWPLDLLWLGMGADGHTASILPGPDFSRVSAIDIDQLAAAVTPDPLPVEAPVARVTMTLPAMRRSRSLLLTITGESKRVVAEQAIEAGSNSDKAIGILLSRMDAPMELFWCP